MPFLRTTGYLKWGALTKVSPFNFGHVGYLCWIPAGVWGREEACARTMSLVEKTACSRRLCPDVRWMLDMPCPLFKISLWGLGITVLSLHLFATMLQGIPCNTVAKANNSFPVNWQQHRLTSKEWWLASLDLQRSCNLPKMTVSQDLWCPMLLARRRWRCIPDRVSPIVHAAGYHHVLHFQERLCYGKDESYGQGWKLPPSYIQMFETFRSFRQVLFLYVSMIHSFKNFDWPLKLSQKNPYPSWHQRIIRI